MVDLVIRRVVDGAVVERVAVGSTDADLDERRVDAIIRSKSFGMGPGYVVDDVEVERERRRRRDPGFRATEANRDQFSN